MVFKDFDDLVCQRLAFYSEMQLISIGRRFFYVISQSGLI